MTPPLPKGRVEAVSYFKRFWHGIRTGGVPIAKSFYKCNICNMSGRPKRVSDIHLAERLRARRAAARVSFAEMASGLGVATSTLTRSLKENSFSKDLGERAREMLEDRTAFEARRKFPSFPEIESKKLTTEQLQILHKIVNLMPKVEVILRNLLKRPARRDRA